VSGSEVGIKRDYIDDTSRIAAWNMHNVNICRISARAARTGTPPRVWASKADDAAIGPGGYSVVPARVHLTTFSVDGCSVSIQQNSISWRPPRFLVTQTPSSLALMASVAGSGAENADETIAVASPAVNTESSSSGRMENLLGRLT
jgi:hypothetical protein